jgi:5-methyltetrahydropteroyltriglutamate--homocysteine methyltransferase
MSRAYRAEQVGSLLRPPELLDARVARAEGRITADALREAEDRAIDEAIQRQRDIGLDVLSDGELRRASWLTDLADAVDGFTDSHLLLEWKGPGGATEATTAKVAGAPLRKTRHLTEYEMPFLQAHAARQPFKVTLPAPSNFMVASYKQGISDRAYVSRGELLQDLVAIIRDDVQWLVQSGVPYVQFDAPYYSHYLDQRQRTRLKAGGLDPDVELADALAADNAALAGIARTSTTVALHVCRGNSRSRWYTEGAYDVIAERVFGALDVDRFLLEYDDARSGGFEALRFVPPGKDVVLGLVTTKRPQLESHDEVCRRIDEAAGFVPLDRLAVSPQCGFASVATGNLIAPDDQWRKLQLVVDVARRVWG